tara:strand:- start:93557 stop:93712 length:156 start_codon:yes stop_codon:yes gene_type:complete
MSLPIVASLAASLVAASLVAASFAAAILMTPTAQGPVIGSHAVGVRVSQLG